MATKPLISRQPALLIALASLTLAQLGCSSDQLPNDAQLNISPASHTIDIVEQRNVDDRCLFNPDNHVDLPLVLALTTGDGAPIGDSEISVYLDFAANTFTGFPALALYKDLNSNGVVDAETELVSGSDDDIAVVNTDRYNGISQLLLRVNLSCGYRGGVYAVAGSTVARSTISVTDQLQSNSAADSTADDGFRSVSDGGRS